MVLPIEPITFFNETHRQYDLKNHYMLRDAVQNGNKALVQLLIDSGAPVNLKTPYPVHTPLHLAVISRSPEMVKILLDKGANISAECYEGDTPLTMAARMENTSIVDLILTYDVRNYQNHHKFSHLHVACMRNRISLVKKLLLMNQGEIINEAVREDSLFYSGYTPLHCAVLFGCIEVVEFLLHSGADITIKDAKGMTPLHLANSLRNEQIIDLILAAHKYVFSNPANSQGLTHYHIACTRDDPAIVEHFLKMAEPIHSRVKAPWEGWGAIHFATYYECPSVIKLLLNRPTLFRDQQFLLLMKCAFLTRKELIYDLILMNENDGFTDCLKYRKISWPLRLARCDDVTECIVKLISEGSMNHTDDFLLATWNGFTSLDLAVRCKSFAAVKYLLDRGANVMVQDAYGKTPIHIAFESKSGEIFSLLLGKLVNLSPNAIDVVGLSLLHMLCTTSKSEIIHTLLANGADVNAQVSFGSPFWAGFTPLHFAVKHHQLGVINLLLNSGADVSLKNGLDQSPFDMIIDELNVDEHAAPSKNVLAKMLLSIHSAQCISNNTFKYQKLSLTHIFSIMCHINSQELLTHLSLHPDEIHQIVQLPGYRELDKSTSLHLAMRFGHFKQAKLILSNGANPNLMNEDRETPLECAFSHQPLHDDSIIECENLFFYTSVRFTAEFKPTHFHIACALGFLTVIKYVFNDVADKQLKMKLINCLNDANQTPLHVLLLQGHRNAPTKEILQFFLDYGADINARDYQLQTPLHYAQTLDPDLILFLINNGADVNARNIFRQTPLRKFCEDILKEKYLQSKDLNFYHRQITTLLESGSDINIVDYTGKSCLYFLRDCKSFNLPRWQNIAITLLKHVAKLQVLGSRLIKMNEYFCNNVPQTISNSFDKVSFVKKCEEEIELMASIKFDTHTTLRDLLSKSLDEIIRLCKNYDTQCLVTTFHSSTKYPLYGYLLKLQIKNAGRRHLLLESSRKSLFALVRKSLPTSCIDEIIHYLSNSDLKNVMSSVGTLT
ncbi:hypothetical protein QAD02_001183 [Eretmocerus hayati]|uniref:Uncharacterized protein n=1 Tax=Eretmocerus hayati TaxID=131215 RepID=A0ACC2NFA3_9HYME|nr:hypothetical protein QAD02_001183 [Eretmocerus hayati]